MKATKVTQKEWLDEATKYIQGGLHRTAYLILDTAVVGVFRKSQTDEGICNALGYEVVETYNNASTVVHNKGDLLFGHFCPIDNGWYDRFVAYFVNWLKAKGLNAEFTDNDILVDWRTIFLIAKITEISQGLDLSRICLLKTVI